MAGIITDEARAWAARPYPVHEFTVARTDIVRYARSIGAENPVYLDVAAAQAAGHPDILAPPYFPFVLRMHGTNLTSRDRLEPDGSATEDVPPLPTKRAMAGETEIEVGPPIHAGDTIVVEKRIIDLSEKSGRSGPLVFVTQEFTFTNQLGVVVFREQYTRIYR